MPRLKRFLSEVKQGIVPQTLWMYEDVGHTQEAKKELLGYVDFQHTENVLNTLKPPRLIQRILQIGTNADAGDIVIDFFSGSASTAHAVLAQNLEDGGNRRFIMAQYPEPLPEPEPHLDTIADMGRVRVRRVIERIQAAAEAGNDPQLSLDLSDEDADIDAARQDLGFKVFKLAPSTFRRWESPAEAEHLEQQLSYFDAGLKDDADLQHVIYEVLLKEGYSLNARIEPLALPANTVYRITDEVAARPEDEDADPAEPQGPPPSFYLCLDDAVAIETLDALPLDDQTTFICLDNALNDSQKVNLALQCVLKTV